MVFASNELPKVYDTTDGFWSKWVLLDFPYKFVPEKVFEALSEEERKTCKKMNPDIITEITTPEELSGLLNLALEGLDRLMDNKDFSYSKGTNEIKDMWIRKSDSFTAFCIDNVEEDYNGKISKAELRRLYHQYKKKFKLQGCSDKAIKVTLEDRYGASEEQEWDGGNRVRVWTGIRVKSDRN